MSVLLVDNCSSHITNDLIDVLTEARVRVMTFAVYTTQIFDVTVCGLVKRNPSYKSRFGDEKVTVRFLAKAYQHIKQTMAESNM
jgi:hypothetical protein